MFGCSSGSDTIGRQTVHCSTVCSIWRLESYPAFYAPQRRKSCGSVLLRRDKRSCRSLQCPSDRGAGCAPVVRQRSTDCKTSICDRSRSASDRARRMRRERTVRRKPAPRAARNKRGRRGTSPRTRELGRARLVLVSIIRVSIAASGWARCVGNLPCVKRSDDSRSHRRRGVLNAGQKGSRAVVRSEG